MPITVHDPTTAPTDEREHPPTRLLVVDDHPAVRWGLVQLLEDQPDFDVAAVATNAESAIAQAEQEGVDVAVVDYQLGGRNGLWLTRRLKALADPPRVVIFSAFANDHLAATGAVAGVDALLNKSSLGDELCNVIRAARRGRRTLPRVPHAMADLLRRRLDGDDQMLFGMLLAGIPTDEIAEALRIGEQELGARKAKMLVELEALPGELAASEGSTSDPVAAVQSYLRVGRS
jgi:DNA-binding NarL/FixJ family response regulator